MPCSKHPHKSPRAALAHLEQIARTSRPRDIERVNVYSCREPRSHNMSAAWHVGHDPALLTFSEEVARRERQQALQQTTTEPAQPFTVRKLVKKQ